MPLQIISNVIMSQVNWLSCVMGAASEKAWLGLVTAAVFMLIHAAIMRSRLATEFLTIVGVSIIGYFVDSVYVVSGLLTYNGSESVFFAPAWIFALWLGFSASLNLAFRWLHRRLRVAAVIGFFGGGIAYWAGSRLGAMTWQVEPITGVVIIALVWSLLMPAAIGLAIWINQVRQPDLTPTPRLADETA